MLEKLSKVGHYLPHVYFAAISIIIAMNPNYVMIGIALFLCSMIFIKNKILNVVVSAFLLFISVSSGFGS